MSLTTCAVTCAIYSDTGLPVSGAVITAKLNRFEVIEGYVVPEVVQVTTDAAGAATLNLWPNALGSTQSSYTITIVSPTGATLRTKATIPNVSTIGLHFVSDLPVYEGKPEGQLIIDAAVASVAPAVAARDVAIANATQAVSSAAAAAASAASASSSADTATTQAGIATVQADAAAASQLDLHTNWQGKLDSAASSADLALAAQSDIHLNWQAKLNTAAAQALAAGTSAAASSTFADAAYLSATLSAASANASAASATTASTQASTATSQAELSATSRAAAEAARDASQLSAGVYATTAVGLAATATGAYFSVPSATYTEYLILYRHDTGDVATEIKRYPSVAGLEYDVARTFYVSMTGLDSNSGTSLKAPKATIAAALTLATAVGQPCIVIVQPGEYTVQPNTVIPANCALYGYDLRVTKLSLPPGQETNNMFQMSNGIKVRGFSFSGLRHEAFDLTSPPMLGWVFVFKPGEIITRSPYIADCSQIHSNTQDQMVLPIDRANGNPLMPRGGGNILADGSVLDLDSPLRSVVVDSFTAINPNGVGYAVMRNAFVQLVSVFTNWSRVGLWAHQGGQITVVNSNTTFGDYAMVSSSYRNVVKATGVENISVLGAYTASATQVITALEGIVTNLMTVRYPTLSTWGLLTSAQKALAERDTRNLLRQIVSDLNSGQDRGSRYFAEGLFDWNAGYAFASSLVSVFVQSWEQVKLELNSRITATNAQSMVTALITMIQNVVQNPANYLTAFASVIEAGGQQLSYSGSGVNYNALPASQRGTGTAPDPITTFLKTGGGNIYTTFSTERGDTYLGTDLRVDFSRNTIEGQAFNRGVQNVTLPILIGLGG